MFDFYLQIGQFFLCQPESLVIDQVIYQSSTHGAMIMDFDISTSYQALAFGDAAGEKDLDFIPHMQPHQISKQ